MLRERLRNYLSRTGENISPKKILWKGRPVNKRDIYIVVMESFINPLLLNVKYEGDPLFPGIRKYLIDGSRFSHVISPVYGGGTAQAEFEILTGVPAFGMIDSIEFNALEGYRIESFINELRKYGYYAYATIGTKSWYYNSQKAYRSVGFDEVSFLDRNSYFRKRKGDHFIFDGDLFKANIRLVREKLLKKKPFVDYILTMYGHLPYYRNTELRPDVVKAIDAPDSINRIANQFYYRTKSLEWFINSIIKFDPASIILVVADHIPPVLENGIKYNLKNWNINIALFVIDGKPVDISGKHYYEIPWCLWDILREKHNSLCRRRVSERNLRNLYILLMGEGMGYLKLKRNLVY